MLERVWRDSPNSGGKLVLELALADYHNDAEGYARPSLAKLAKKARMTESNTRYLLREMERDGGLVIERNAGPRGCNLFTLQYVQGEAHFTGG